LSAHIDESKFTTTIYEQNAALGRKFLVAGDGGLNLTHSEPTEQFIEKYIPSKFIEKYIQQFTNYDLVDWLKLIGISTFIGSSGRVFPEKNTKPIQVLNAIIEVLNKKNVIIKTNHKWQGWDVNGDLLFENKKEQFSIKPDIIVFALGGKSWKVTGSDGKWEKYFIEKGIYVEPFEASNCGVKINWNHKFIQQNAGNALKNILIKCNDDERKGEVVITQSGMEGGAIYALSSAIRKQLKTQNQAIIYIDLKPIFSNAEILNRLHQPKKNSINNHLSTQLGLSKVAIELLNAQLSKNEFTDNILLSKKIKNLPITITSLAEIDEAISTVGGIALTEINENFKLKKCENIFCIGEMLNWDAPTGGYLLQANFSMGYCLAQYFNAAF
ncbi:MAG: hypothetical protein RIQ33_2074, partial [Bacteroidota bacterium]